VPFQSMAVRLLGGLVGILLLVGGGFAAGYRYVHAEWSADNAARAVESQRALDAARATERDQAATTERVNAEAQQQIDAMAGYISGFLRKPASAGRPVPKAPAGPAVTHAEPIGQPSAGSCDAVQVITTIDADTAGVCAAGWEQVTMWRQWAREQHLAP